tara:strand:- start:652 stop:1071 length:420 start_codon:yes stop_codon:yes gene_type:complete
MNAHKLNTLALIIPQRWSNEGEGLMILESRKEDIVEALNRSYPNRCPSCDGRAVDLRKGCLCTPDESDDGLWANPLNLTERLTPEGRVGLCPSNCDDAELPQSLQDLVVIEELITSEEMRLYCKEEGLCQRTGRPYYSA